jgi:hypothetical protein
VYYCHLHQKISNINVQNVTLNYQLIQNSLEFEILSLILSQNKNSNSNQELLVDFGILVKTAEIITMAT